jgi:hypothetical protein
MRAAHRARRVSVGLEVLRDALAARGVLDERVGAELDAGRRYWALERRVCAALGRGVAPDAADVAACHAAKSFDYRVLHCVLHRLLATPYDDQLLAFLRLDELLVDVGDDLTDYEDDVCANSFNIFRQAASSREATELHAEPSLRRCYVALHGPQEAQLQLAAYVSGLEAQHAEALSALPEAAKQRFWARHADASAVPGAGRWVLPRPIALAAEQEYRARVADAEAASG